MLSCIIMGGLGNQLFQIYTTIALSMEMKTNFNFPRNKMETDKRSDTYWDDFSSPIKRFISSRYEAKLKEHFENHYN